MQAARRDASPEGKREEARVALQAMRKLREFRKERSKPPGQLYWNFCQTPLDTFNENAVEVYVWSHEATMQILRVEDVE